MTKDERIKQLEGALRPFANAWQRCAYYKSPTNYDIPLMAGTDNVWELFADESEPHGKDPQELLAVGHLANAEQILHSSEEVTDE